MTLRSQNSVEEILLYDENIDLEKEIHECMRRLLIQFNGRLLNVIEGIEPNPRKKKNFFDTLRKGLHSIIGNSKNKSSEDIKQTVLINCARLMHLSEEFDIGILPIFGNIILMGTSHKSGVRIGTISIRGNNDAWGIQGGFSMDSPEKIYLETRKYLQKDTSQTS